MRHLARKADRHPIEFRWGVAVLLCSTILAGQSKIGPASDVAERLLQDGSAPQSIKLDPAEKPEALRQLTAARGVATGKRLQKISFWLATLGSDYKRNRNYLLDALRGCNIQNPDCDEDTAGLLIGLHEQGHHEVLHALMVAGRQSDGALSEMLGPFYGEVLAKDPSSFVAGLRRVDAPTQKAVCTLAGGADGGGIAPADLIAARQRLTLAGGDVALRCLREIENINREIDSAGKQ